MFRKMRRFKQSLDEAECIAILKEEPRGVMAVHGEDGYPYAFPMNQIYMEGKLYFHCAKEGHKLDAIMANERVSFCIMDKGFRKEGQWPLNIKSVIVFGKVRTIDDPKEMRPIAKALGMKHYPTEDEVEKEIEADLSRVLILELTIDHMTGKLVNES